jgi:DNA-binding protein H-NS
MKTLEEVEAEKAKLTAQLAELAQQEAEILKKERPTVIARINLDIARYKIKDKDLKFLPEEVEVEARQTAGERPPVQPKYQNPDTGATWSGRGNKPPEWMGPDKSQWHKFLIKKD